MILKKLSVENKDEIASFFKGVFMREPWNDDWSDEKQLNQYILDLIGNPNSLIFGFFEDDHELVGLAMGCIRHWYEGTEYEVAEFCISAERQGQGIGTEFIKSIAEYIRKEGICRIFLQTERGVPAYEFYKKQGFVEMSDHVSFVKMVF